MATSSTNKQPLLIDRPIFDIIRLDNTSTPANQIDPGTGTSGALLLDCTDEDGALIESIWLIQRVVNDVTPIRLFLSTSSLALGVGLSGSSASAQFIAQAAFPANTPVGAILEFQLPKILAPVPHAGANTSGEPMQFRGMRVERGRAIWAAANSPTPQFNSPQVGIQGGFH